MPRRDGFGQRRVGRIVREVAFAGEEADVRPAFVRDVIANRSAQHRVARFDRVEHARSRDVAVEFELHLAVDARERLAGAPAARRGSRQRLHFDRKHGGKIAHDRVPLIAARRAKQ